MAIQSEPTDRDYNIKTVDNALEILDLLSEADRAFSLSEIAGKLRMSRNCAFRIIRTLQMKKLVEQDAVTSCYRLGICSVAFGQKLVRNVNVINYAHPVLEGLAQKLDETIYYTVLKDDEVLFVDMADCAQQIKTTPFIGRILPFFSNAAGKVMKSFESRDIISRITKKKGKSELEALDKELDEIRTKGIAVDKEGLGEGIISVAVAIRDYTGRAIGAITLVGPSFRMLTDRLEMEIIPSLKEGADLLSGRFGYSPA